MQPRVLVNNCSASRPLTTNQLTQIVRPLVLNLLYFHVGFGRSLNWCGTFQLSNVWNYLLGIFKTLQSTLTIELAWVNLNFSCISEVNASWSTGGGGPNFPIVPWQADSSRFLQRLSKKTPKVGHGQRNVRFGLFRSSEILLFEL